MTLPDTDTDTDTGPAAPRRPSPGRRFARDLREDATSAVEHIVFSRLLGSVLLPRTARRLLLRAAGARAGSGPGGGFRLVGRPGDLTIGTSVYMNRGVFVEAVAPVSIGSDSALGMEVMIVTSHHELSPTGAWDSRASGRPVTIGERVWVGARAVILPGAVIEDDVVVAAGAVVTGRLSSHGVYAGVPARRIRDHAASETVRPSAS